MTERPEFEPDQRVHVTASCGTDVHCTYKAWVEWFSFTHWRNHNKGHGGLSASCPDLVIRAEETVAS